MRRKAREADESKVLDVNASMQGTLRFDDPVNLRINGKFEGALDTKGKLTVGQNADIKANITGETISIAGTVNGNIKAAEILKLESSANLTGDVSAPKLEVADGAVLNGRITMKQEAKSVTSSSSSTASSVSSRGDWMTTDQLAEYLEVGEDKVNEWASEKKLPGTKEGGEWVFERAKVDQWIADGRVKS